MNYITYNEFYLSLVLIEVISILNNCKKIRGSNVKFSSNHIFDLVLQKHCYCKGLLKLLKTFLLNIVNMFSF